MRVEVTKLGYRNHSGINLLQLRCRSLALPSFTSYDFRVPGSIVFGWGRRVEIGRLAANLGRRTFLISGSRYLDSSGAIAEITAHLENAGLQVSPLTTISREPRVEDVDTAAWLLAEHGAGAGDLVLAVGGGSTIDLAKASAAMATNRESNSVRDYLEGVGSNLVIKYPPLPCMVMPTTAGTGSEATKNAVISSIDPPFKKSLRSELMMPKAVLVDPELTVGLPPQISAQTGMDAITQLIESYISKRAKPIPQALALQGLSLASPAVSEAYKDGSSRPAREAMAHAALLSGMALANSGLGMAHGVAAALGILCDVPHGLACAVMLPAALRANMSVCRDQYAEMALAIGESAAFNRDALAHRFVHRIMEICAELRIPQRLSEVGVRQKDLPALVKSSRGNSMSGNPREISDSELSDILEGML